MATTFGFRCDVCSLSVNSQEQLTQHFTGSRHQKNAARPIQGRGQAIIKPTDYFVPSGFEGSDAQKGTDSSLYYSQNQEAYQGQTPATSVIYSNNYCPSCRVKLTSMSQAQMHYNGAKHRQKLKLLEEKNNPTPSEEEEVPSKKAKVSEMCQVCNVKLIHPAVAETHYTGSKHKKKVELLQSLGVDVNSGNGETFLPPTTVANSKAKAPSLQPVKASLLHCSFCGVSVNSQAQMEAHRSGGKHKGMVEKMATPQQQVSNNAVTSAVANPVTNSVANPLACSYTYTQQVQYAQSPAMNYGTGVPGQYVSQY